MTNMISKICAAAAVIVAFSSVPASAASIQYGGAQVQNAQFSFGMRNDDGRRDGRFERRGNNYYYNGERGYRERRSGYRQYNGYWFPQSAFSLSFSFGNGRVTIGNGTRLSARHVEWCEDRYRSYRSSDNSFQPNRGSRQECVSPYSR